jgi:hypothetical protein
VDAGDGVTSGWTGQDETELRLSSNVINQLVIILLANIHYTTRRELCCARPKRRQVRSRGMPSDTPQPCDRVRPFGRVNVLARVRNDLAVRLDWVCASFWTHRALVHPWCDPTVPRPPRVGYSIYGVFPRLRRWSLGLARGYYIMPGGVN